VLKKKLLADTINTTNNAFHYICMEENFGTELHKGASLGMNALTKEIAKDKDHLHIALDFRKVHMIHDHFIGAILSLRSNFNKEKQIILIINKNESCNVRKYLQELKLTDILKNNYLRIIYLNDQEELPFAVDNQD